MEAVRSLVAAGLGLSIQPDMTYRPWSLEGDIIEARPLADLSAIPGISTAMAQLVYDHFNRVG